MEYGLFFVSLGLFLFGIFRFLRFRYRLRHYERTKAIVTNIEIETRYFSSDGTEITKEAYEYYSQTRALYKDVSYYSPEITYQAKDGNIYTGTWWTEMAGSLPYNIGERVEIYYKPDQPAKFFLFDKMMMFWEPVMLATIGLIGSVFFIKVILD